uniref:ATP-binding protein n=1 Tax=Trueperella sp. TaxID=2699835 RepID=UPI0037367C77
IFERFYRTDSSRSRTSGGSGLGLAIVSAIMAAHGGTARAYETPGGGLTVRLTFPRLLSDSRSLVPASQ